MRKQSAIIFLSSLSGLTCLAHADFFHDSSSSLMLQNYFFESEYRNEKTTTRPQQSKKEEWAQGATLNFNSGYTEGKVGVGLDISAMLGAKLYSNAETSGTGLLPTSTAMLAGEPSYAHNSKDGYARIGGTAKMKYENNILKYGTLQPVNLPVLFPNTARLFPQTFRGWSFESTQLQDVNFRMGRIDRVMQRDSSNYTDLGIDTGYTRYKQSRPSDAFSYAGLDYKISPDVQASYYFSQLKDTYDQHYLGVKVTKPFGKGKFTSDLRYFNSYDSGQALVGSISNQMYTSSFSYQLKHHLFNVGYQKVDGSEALPYLKGAGPYTPTTVMVSYFILPHESTWWLRYDYNFAGLGLPGLVLSNKYLHGFNARIAGNSVEKKEWERDTELAYTMQSGKFKNLSLRLRHASFRSSLDRGTDQTRVLLTYTFHLK
nr:OprD family porin [Acinetobacter baumannii]MDO7413334.1 OprD family outer membrane porin [Acinetobacter baumannii]